MKPWLYCFEVAAKLLVNSFLPLFNDFVRIFDKATANAWGPCS
jgi:hypothetical protein